MDEERILRLTEEEFKHLTIKTEHPECTNLFEATYVIEINGRRWEGLESTLPKKGWMTIGVYQCPTPEFEKESITRITIEEKWLSKDD